MASWNKEEWLERRAEELHEDGLDWKDACIQAQEDLDNGDMEEPINYEEEV
tara:strand:- start:71 stop:223 length:153 start_codon:yes stop_codon:yes gene_type:complete